ncbi:MULTISPECIES: hypothetical protein [Streptomyces]|nr:MULTISPECIES: hypothetical protein [Streptomyces]MDI5908366.1 hypothetical protein [Streptomyces sp. 12257]
MAPVNTGGAGLGTASDPESSLSPVLTRAVLAAAAPPFGPPRPS